MHKRLSRGSSSGLNESESKNFNVATCFSKDRVNSFHPIFEDACDHKQVKNQTRQSSHFSKHDWPKDSPADREKGLPSPKKDSHQVVLVINAKSITEVPEDLGAILLELEMTRQIFSEIGVFKARRQS